MEYSPLEKLEDGRYFTRITSDVKIVERQVRIGEIAEDSVITLNDTSCVKSFDDKIIDDATSHSQEWFNREISRDTITKYYQSALEDTSLQVIANKTSKGRMNVHMFDENGQVLQSIEPGSVCNVLLHLEGVWFLKKSFGPVWRILQVRRRRVAKPIECLIDDDCSD